MQRDNQCVAVTTPCTNFLSIDSDISQRRGNGQLQLGNRRTRHQVVDKCTAVNGSLAKRYQMKYIRLNTSFQLFNLHRRFPIRFTNAKRLLKIWNRSWKIRQRFFDEQIDLTYRCAKSGSGNDANVPSYRFGFGKLDMRQIPRTSGSNFILFETQAHQLPTLHILAKDDFKVSLPFDRIRVSHVVCDTCAGHGNDGVIGRQT